MENFLSSRKTVIILLTSVFTFFLFFIYKYYGGYEYAGDGLRHYLVSRWCWNHHELLLYLWGKPFFTLITSPFSHFGHKAIQLFNLGVSLIGAYTLFEIARHYQIRNRACVILFVFCSPVFFSVVNTGLTEPMFFVMIALSALLLLKEKYIPASILASFLPFVRAEGNIIIMLFLLVLLIRKKYAVIPWLLTGNLVYAVAGYFHYKDFLWVFTMNEYNGANKEFYGQGELLTFVKAHDRLLGLPLSILFLLGILHYAKESFTKKIFSYLKSHDVEIFILLGSFGAYFVAHSIFWWKGLYNSLGLLRPIAGVAPLAGIVCLRGLNLAENYIVDRKYTRSVFSGGFVFWVATVPFVKGYFPQQLNEEDKVTKQAVEWFRESPYKDRLIFYLNPFLVEQLHRDPFNDNQVRELWGLLPGIKEWGYDALPDSTVVFWDAHFGPNEARINLEALNEDPHFQFLNTFRPETPFTTLGGYNYEINLFAKISSGNKLIPSSLTLDFENSVDMENAKTIVEGDAHSGTKVSQLNDQLEYSALYPVSIRNILNIDSVGHVEFNCFVKSENAVSGAKIVLSIAEGDKTLAWMSTDLLYEKSSQEPWQRKDASFAIDLKSYNSKDAVLKLYVWNKGHENLMIDDVTIKFVQ